MEKNENLNVFFMKKFLTITILTGIVEWLLGQIYTNFALPFLDKIFNLSTIVGDISLTKTTFFAFEFIISLIFSDILYVFPVNTSNITKSGTLYTTGLICILIIIFIIWLAPYIIAAVLFGISTSEKISLIEKQRIQQQKQYEKQRNLLLSDIAHDLKTPITTIAGYSQALADGEISDAATQKEYLKTICTKSLKISELITLLFEYIRLDSEGFELKKEKTNIAELIRSTIAALYTDFEEKEIELAIRIPEENVTAYIDKLQFERVIYNLMINIIKHNPGKTRAGIFLENDNVDITISICDTGPLIDETISKHIFEPFVQSDMSRNSRNGSGLGLCIAEKIITMHGGKIRLIQLDNTNKASMAGYNKKFVITLYDI